MTPRLAILAPSVGAVSESFVRRHMTELLPGRTVIVAHTARPPLAGQWSVDAPTLVLDTLRLRGLERIRSGLAGRFGGAVAKVEVGRFLAAHGVVSVLAEYLDRTVPWLRPLHALNLRVCARGLGYDLSSTLRERRQRDRYRRLEEAEAIAVVTRIGRERLIDLGISPARVHVVPCGVPVPPAPPEHPPGDRVRCLAVGRMVAKKDPLAMLRAFHRAASSVPNLDLDVVGTGPLHPATRALVDDLRLGDRVRFLGDRPLDEVHRLMRAADLFVQHSRTDPATGDEEGLPVAILDAMAQALPVISTRHGGIPDAVMEGVSGELVEPGDVDGMADRIVALALDPDRRASQGRAGWARAQDRFTWERERQDLLRLLGLEGPPVPPDGAAV